MIEIKEGNIKKNLNDPPTTPRPAPPKAQAAYSYGHVLADPKPITHNFSGLPHPKTILDVNISVWEATLINHERILAGLEETVENTNRYAKELQLRNAARTVLEGLRAYKVLNDGAILIDPDAKEPEK